MKKLLLAVGLAVVTLAAGRWLFSSSEDAPGNRLLVDRVWLDHQPTSETEPVQIFVALVRNPVGIFERTSAWKGEHEIFKYEPSGDKLKVFFPQTRETQLVAYRAGKCDGGPYDYCLELTGTTRGVKRYVSKKGWEIRSLDEGRALIESLSR